MKRHILRVCHEYIEQSWFLPYKDKFCAAWLVGVEHFGQISSSKVYSAHAAFKKTLETSQMVFFLRLSLHEGYLQRTTR